MTTQIILRKTGAQVSRIWGVISNIEELQDNNSLLREIIDISWTLEIESEDYFAKEDWAQIKQLIEELEKEVKKS